MKRKKVILNVGDNVLIPQTADDKDNPTIKAVVKEIKSKYELVVEVIEGGFELPVPTNYCKKV